MRTGGPASADSAHNGMESAPLPVRLTENGLTADAGKKERLQRDSQAWGTPHHGDNPPCGTGTETTRGFRYSSRYLAEPPRQASFGRGGLGTFSGGAGRPFRFRPCSGFSQENGTGAHTLYRIYRFGRAILLLNRVKILKKRYYEAEKEEISPYTEVKRSVEK